MNLENFKEQKRKLFYTNEKYCKILSKLDEIKNFECFLRLNDAVGFDFKNLSDIDKVKLEDIAKDLKPWRKGPFDLDGLFIDAEWKSFIKYNLLKPFFNLENKVVADVGCNNGYYMFKMLEQNPKKVIGFDPSVHTAMQFKFLNHFAKTDIKYELLGVEHLPFYECKFDVIFCLGVIYHRSDPIKMLKDLKQSLNKNAEVYLDTMYIQMDGEYALAPGSSYSKMSNVYFIPTISALENWCEKAKFKDFEVLATKDTDFEEQRKTDWIDTHSLNDFLDKNDSTKTVEGYPAPKRVYVRLKN